MRDYTHRLEFLSNRAEQITNDLTRRLDELTRGNYLVESTGSLNSLKAAVDSEIDSVLNLVADVEHSVSGQKIWNSEAELDRLLSTEDGTEDRLQRRKSEMTLGIHRLENILRAVNSLDQSPTVGAVEAVRSQFFNS